MTKSLHLFFYLLYWAAMRGLLCFTLNLISMHKIMLLLTILLFVSCSRIVTADYELLDEGVITAIDKEKGMVSVTSRKDSICREWFPETVWDGLSMRALAYTDTFNIGDKCYVYEDGDKPLISKVSVADAKQVNAFLSRWYWRDLFTAGQIGVWVLLALMVHLAFVFPVKDETTATVYFMLTFFALAVAVARKEPGRTLEKLGAGVITQIDGARVTLDGQKVYFVAAMEDIADKQTLEKGQSVYVYGYGVYHLDGKLISGSGEDIFMSRRKLCPAALDKQQIYPEIMLRTSGLYLLVQAIVSGALSVGLVYLVPLFRRKDKNG